MSGTHRGATPSACPLCESDGGPIVHRDADLRIVLVADADHPGFCRVIWNAHVAEMTDLAPPQIARLIGAVLAVEDALRAVLRPVKVNLASLGNQVPHLHWHVIPRFADDAQFPGSVWSKRRRATDPATLAARAALLPTLGAEIRSRLPRASGDG